MVHPEINCAAAPLPTKWISRNNCFREDIFLSEFPDTFSRKVKFQENISTSRLLHRALPRAAGDAIRLSVAPRRPCARGPPPGPRLAKEEFSSIATSSHGSQGWEVRYLERLRLGEKAGALQFCAPSPVLRSLAPGASALARRSWWTQGRVRGALDAPYCILRLCWGSGS